MYKIITGKLSLAAEFVNLIRIFFSSVMLMSHYRINIYQKYIISAMIHFNTILQFCVKIINISFSSEAHFIIRFCELYCELHITQNHTSKTEM